MRYYRATYCNCANAFRNRTGVDIIRTNPLRKCFPDNSVLLYLEMFDHFVHDIGLDIEKTGTTKRTMLYILESNSTARTGKTQWEVRFCRSLRYRRMIILTESERRQSYYIFHFKKDNSWFRVSLSLYMY